MLTNRQPPFVEIDTASFSAEAVRRAAYDLSGLATFVIEQASEGSIHVWQNPARESSGSPVTEEEFRVAVLDHQVRIDTESRFGAIRTLLVARALEPQADLGKVLAGLGFKDRP